MKPKLLTPGPTPMAQNVLEALAQPAIHHRSPEFSEILKETLSRSQKFFGTTQPVLILSTTGTGGMEAALVHGLCKNDQVLCLVSGKFGERWADMAENFGMTVIRQQNPWGEATNLTELEKNLKAHPDIKAVFCQACETSTATVEPVQEIGKLLHAKFPETLFIVDGISAVGICDIEMDRDHIDILVAGSQKALAMPTGLSLVGLSKKAQQAYDRSNIPKYYLDLKREWEANEKLQTAFSSPVHLIFALNEGLKNILREPKDTYVQRQKAIFAAVDIFQLQIFSKNPSLSVTAITMPEGVAASKVAKEIQQNESIKVVAGQDHLKDKIIRVGHMGYIFKEDYKKFVKGLGQALNKLGHPISEAQLEKAQQAISDIAPDPNY